MTSDLLDLQRINLARWGHVLAGTSNEGAAVPIEVLDALSDDLNTPRVLAAVHALAKEGDVQGLWSALAILGLGDLDIEFSRQIGDAAEQFRIDELVNARTAARARKDFAESDRIRDELAVAGIILEDGPAGTTWRRA